MIEWVFVRIKCKLGSIFGKSEETIKKRYFLKKGLRIGSNCCIYSDISTPESQLISVGDNVTISNDVQFLTHDNSIDRLSAEKCDIFGEIKIGNNCFVGARAIILPGVTLGDCVVVGAGSVVTKSFPNGAIIAGNPAKQISTASEYLDKYSAVAFSEEDYRFGKQQGIWDNAEKIIRNR